MPGKGTHTAEWDRAVKNCQAARREAGQDPEACYGIITKRFKDAGKKIMNESKIVILRGSFLTKFDGIERIKTDIKLVEKEPQTEYVDLEEGWKLAKGILRVRGTGLTEGNWIGIDGNDVTYPLDAIHAFAESQLKTPRKLFHDNKDGKTVGFNTGIKLIENGYKYQADVFDERAARMIEKKEIDGSSDELEILATQIGEDEDGKPQYLALEIKGQGAAFVKYPACEDAGIDDFRRIDLEVFSTTDNEGEAMDLENETPDAAEEAPKTEAELEQTEDAPQDSKVEELEKALEVATSGSESIASELEKFRAENAEMLDAFKMVKEKLTKVTGELEEKKDVEWKELEGKVKAAVPGYKPAILEGLDRDKKKDILSYLLSLKPALEEKDDKDTRTASEALTGAMEAETEQKDPKNLKKDAVCASLGLKIGDRVMTFDEAMSGGLSFARSE